MRVKNGLSLVIGSMGFLFVSMSAMAQDAGAAATIDAYASLGAAIAIGLAALGGAIGQSKTAAAALDGIARNPTAQPKIFPAMIIALALIESLVILAFLVAFIKIKI